MSGDTRERVRKLAMCIESAGFDMGVEECEGGSTRRQEKAAERAMRARQELLALLAPEPATSAGEREWRPIETVPKDGTPVLVLMPKPLQHSRVHAAWFQGSIGVIGTMFAFDAPSKPTHWMPLPSFRAECHEY